MNRIPFIHPVVDEGVDTGVGHCQPVECQVYVPYVRRLHDLGNDNFIAKDCQEQACTWITRLGVVWSGVTNGDSTCLKWTNTPENGW